MTQSGCGPGKAESSGFVKLGSLSEPRTVLPFIDPEDESRVGVFDFHLQIGEITRNRTGEARHVGDWTFGALSFTGCAGQKREVIHKLPRQRWYLGLSLASGLDSGTINYDQRTKTRKK